MQYLQNTPVVLFMFTFSVLFAGDYTSNAVYSDMAPIIGMDITQNGKSLLISLKNSGIKECSLNTLTCIKKYSPSWVDGYIHFVQSGVGQDGKNCFYIQGLKGALFEESRSQPLEVNQIISTDSVACLQDDKNLSATSEVFVGHNEIRGDYYDCSITLNRINDGAEKSKYELLHSGYATSLVLNKSKNKLIAACACRVTLAIWDIELQKLEECIVDNDVYSNTFKVVAVDEKQYLVASEKGTLVCSPYEPSQSNKEKILDAEEAESVSFLSDNLIASVQRKGSVKVFDIRKEGKISELCYKDQVKITDICVKDQDLFFTACSDNTVVEWKKSAS